MMALRDIAPFIKISLYVYVYRSCGLKTTLRLALQCVVQIFHNFRFSYKLCEEACDVRALRDIASFNTLPLYVYVMHAVMWPKNNIVTCFAMDGFRFSYKSISEQNMIILT